MLPNRPVANLMWNAVARSRGLLSPFDLQSLQLARRFDSLALASDKQIRPRHTHNINDLDVDRSEHRYLLSAGGDGLVSVFDVSCPLNRRGFIAAPLHPTAAGRDHGAAVGCVQWYPFDTGMFVSGGAEGRVMLWDTNRLQAAHSFSLGAGPVHAARMSGIATTHSLVATGSHASPNVRLCDPNSGALTHTLLGHSAPVTAIDWSPADEFLLASGGQDGRLRVWDIRRAGALLNFDQYNQHAAQLNRRYADLAEQKQKRDAAAHTGSLQCVRWLPSGRQLCTGGSDRALRLWDATSGRNELVHYQGAAQPHRINRFAISPDARTLFYPSARAVLAFRVADGQQGPPLQGGHLERVHAVAANDNTQEIYSAGADRHVLVWEPRPPRAPAADDPDEELERRERAEREEESQRDADREALMRLMRPREQRSAPPPVVGAAAGAAAPAAAAPGRGRSQLDADRDYWSDED